MSKIYNNPEIKTETDRARQKFIDKGLSYSDITESKFYLLLSILAEELKNFNNNSFEMRISKRLKKDMPIINFDDDGNMTNAYIKVSSYYFGGREGISFNTDGWIGFAGWACSTNLIPFCMAFEKWVDVLSEKKEV